MLSEQERNVLVLLEELKSSSLPPREQTDLVVKINELLQVLQDEAEAAELLEPSTQADKATTFVKLCRLRVLEAQRMCLENYNALRAAKTRQKIGGDGTGHEASKDADALDEFASTFGNDDALAQSLHESKSESITKILQRIHGMAQGEVLKGELNINELEISSKTLRELQESYSAVDLLLNGSRRLVKLLDEAEKWDRWCMLASLGFLAFVLAYIVYRRILSGPLKLLMWSVFQLVGLAKLVPLPAYEPAHTQAQHAQAIHTEPLPIGHTLETTQSGELGTHFSEEPTLAGTTHFTDVFTYAAHEEL